MLPNQLELAPQDLTPPGQHPILLLFGRQQHVRPNFLHTKGQDYLEFIVAVPYVQWAVPGYPYHGPFAFLPRLYLDHWLPTVLGWLCGFAKRRAIMAETADAYEVRFLLTQKLAIRGNFAGRGDLRPPADFSHFEPMRDVFLLPLVTRMAMGYCVCLDFDWHLDKAQLQAVDGRVDVGHAFVPGLPVDSFVVKGLDDAPLGAFRFVVPWSLTRPFWPSALRAAPSAPAALRGPLGARYADSRYKRQGHR
jgi:hypothetical protein